MKESLFITCIIVAFSTGSCIVSGSDAKRFMTVFNVREKDFDSLVTLLQRQKLPADYAYRKQMPDDILKMMHNLHITDINLNVTPCRDTVAYEFVTSWASNAKVYFSKSACHGKEATKGYYKKSSEMIEVWGLGNNWIMWIDHDFY